VKDFENGNLLEYVKEHIPVGWTGHFAILYQFGKCP